MADNNNLELIHNALIDLQSVLKERFVLLEEIKELPLNLKAKQQSLRNANSKYLELTENYNKAKESLASNSFKYDDAVKHRVESEKKMDEISTQREYEALSKQIDEAKIKEQSLLKARNVSQYQVNDLLEKLSAQQNVCDQITEEVRIESEKIDEIITAKQEQIDALDSKCQELRKDLISDELFAKFSSIVQNKKGVGIVPIHGKVCQGCNMILPVQFVNDVRSNYSIEFCPYCSRIMFYEESEDTLDLDSITSQDDEEFDEDASSIVDSSDFDDVL